MITEENLQLKSKVFNLSELSLSLYLQNRDSVKTVILRDIDTDKVLIAQDFKGQKSRNNFVELFNNINDKMSYEELQTRLNTFMKTSYKELGNMTPSKFIRSRILGLKNASFEAQKALTELYGEIDIDEELKVNSGHHQYIEQSKDLAYFYRRSTKHQSNYEIDHILKTYCENKTLFFADNSSSFKNIAFLEFLETCKENTIKNVEVLEPSRSAVETVTRSYENALIIVNYIEQNRSKFESIKVQGLDLLDRTQSATFLLMVSTTEQTWLSLANTQYYPKHDKYLKKAKNQKVELSKIEAKEYRALLNKNRTTDKLIQWLDFLKFKAQ